MKNHKSQPPVCSRLAPALVFALSLASSAHADETGAIEVTRAWTTTHAPGDDAQLFMTITNRADAPDALLRIRCPIATAAEKLTVDIGEGAPAPRAVREISIPAKQSVTLSKEGFHIVLLQTTQELARGETFPCALAFRNGGNTEISVTVAAEGTTTAP